MLFFWPYSFSEDSIENCRRTLFQLLVSMEASCKGSSEDHLVLKFLEMLKFFSACTRRDKFDSETNFICCIAYIGSFPVLIRFFAVVDALETDDFSCLIHGYKHLIVLGLGFLTDITITYILTPYGVKLPALNVKHVVCEIPG